MYRNTKLCEKVSTSNIKIYIWFVAMKVLSCNCKVKIDIFYESEFILI